MAGIGFRLARMARDGGVGGIAGAAIYGAMISAGPWLVTVIAALALDGWMHGRTAAADRIVVQTALVYAFSLSALAAAPVSLLSARLVADRIFAHDAKGVPGIALAALGIGTALALTIGTILFGLLAHLPFAQAFLATLTLTGLTQIWIISPLLTATHHYRLVTGAYGFGVLASSAMLFVWPSHDATVILAAIAVGVICTLAIQIFAFRRKFDAAQFSSMDLGDRRTALLLSFAGCMAILAVWIDKWLLWLGPESRAVLGHLRINPINDHGSFLGLLTIVPGLTLVLIITETRFDSAFDNLVIRCTGTSTRERIEEARRELFRVILDDLRLLLIVQSLLAALAWVFAVPLFDFLGADTRGIFAFRHTALGVLFHLVLIQMTVVLAYYDLFARISLVWLSFAAASLLAVIINWHLGLAAFGWGYMAGAIVGATVATALVLQATSDLTYLLFVGNNPAIVGLKGRWQ